MLWQRKAEFYTSSYSGLMPLYLHIRYANTNIGNNMTFVIGRILRCLVEDVKVPCGITDVRIIKEPVYYITSIMAVFPPMTDATMDLIRHGLDYQGFGDITLSYGECPAPSGEVLAHLRFL